ncbi:MAG TPA: hypothetical protein VGL29_18650 [Blastocatellia bacterium]
MRIEKDLHWLQASYQHNYSLLASEYPDDVYEGRISESIYRWSRAVL